MTKRNLGVAVVFLMGCATGGVSNQLVVPKASAQQAATLTTWEYSCAIVPDGSTTTQFANQYGAQGWELTLVRTANLKSGHQLADRSPDLYCFKRPKT
jgi:hypothetical protein